MCGSRQNHLLKAHPVSEENGRLAKVSGKLGDSGVVWVGMTVC